MYFFPIQVCSHIHTKLTKFEIFLDVDKNRGSVLCHFLFTLFHTLAFFF